MTQALALPRINLELPAMDRVANLGIALFNKVSYRPLFQAATDLRLLSALAEVHLLPFESVNLEKYKRQELRKSRRLRDNLLPFGKRMRWIANNISHYSAPIPIDILEQVSELHDKLRTMQGMSDTVFGVEYLGTVNFETVARERDAEERAAMLRRQRLADPFIYVRNGGVNHHILVWDEPTFFPKRTEG